MINTPELWLSLLTLIALELVLGIDNIIFISILAGKLPAGEREKARRLGLMGALVSRLALLSLVSFISRLTYPLMDIGGVSITGRMMILFAGGLFLIYKATKEIHAKLELADESSDETPAAKTLWSVVIQIIILDIVFSIDSVITAVGLTQNITIMIVANVLALAVMLVAASPIAAFIEEHPSLKILALSFLIMIGLVLIGEGYGLHIPKGYVYFAMGFSFLVEMLNLRTGRKKHEPVQLHHVPKESQHGKS